MGYQNRRGMAAQGQVPEVQGEKTYTRAGALLFAFGMAMAHLGPFWGIFFGTKGENGEWPVAWWAFSFVGNAIVQFFIALQYYPSKYIRTSDAITAYSYSGRELFSIPIAEIESICEAQGWCGAKIAITITDSYLEELKAKSRCCSCCHRKRICMCVREHKQFLCDNGTDAAALAV